MKLMLLAPLLLLAACTQPRWALCNPTPAGCKVVEVYDDRLSCNFATMARNGKDEVLDDLRCYELPEGWR